MRLAARERDEPFEVFVSHAGALGGLANCRPFLERVLAGGYRRVLLPDADRAGRVAAPAFKALMNLCGVSVVYADGSAGRDPGWRSDPGWSMAEAEAVCDRVVVAVPLRPSAALARIGPEHWLVSKDRAGFESWPGLAFPSTTSGVELWPGLDFPPVTCCLLAGFLEESARIGRMLERGQLRVGGGDVPPSVEILEAVVAH